MARLHKINEFQVHHLQENRFGISFHQQLGSDTTHLGNHFLGEESMHLISSVLRGDALDLYFLTIVCFHIMLYRRKRTLVRRSLMLTVDTSKSWEIFQTKGSQE